MPSYDVCVVGGGGVVGSAIARHLATKGYRVVAVERHDSPAKETSGANSGVIHSGFHEIQSSLKAPLAREGSKELTTYAERNDIPILKCGMLIATPSALPIATLFQEAGSMWRLWQGGRKQEVAFQLIPSRESIRRIAPIKARAGIFIPSVCVIDPVRLIETLQVEASTAGVTFRYDFTVRKVTVDREFYVVSNGAEEFVAPVLINSAGTAAHEMSLMAGGPDYSVELIRGEYYELCGGIDRWGVHTLVYPVIPARSRSKGIHLDLVRTVGFILAPTRLPFPPIAHRKMFFLKRRANSSPKFQRMTSPGLTPASGQSSRDRMASPTS